MRKKVRIFAFFMALLMLFTFVDVPSLAAEMTTTEESTVVVSQVDVDAEEDVINTMAEDEDAEETSERGISDEFTDYGISGPRWYDNGTVVWDCVYFGRFWQNDTNGDVSLQLMRKTQSSGGYYRLAGTGHYCWRIEISPEKTIIHPVLG